MMLLIMFLVFVLTQCKSSAGFLYSPITNSFICNSNELSKTGSIPLRFVISVPDTHNKRRSGKFELNFDVLNISGRPGNGNKISINRRGEVKLYKGDRCEAAYGMHLKTEICKRTPRQIFIWVPEQHFSEFVNVVVNKAEKLGKKDEQQKDPYSELKDSIDDIKKLVRSKRRLSRTVSDDCKSPLKELCEKNGKKGKFTDRMVDTYLWAYCTSRPTPKECDSIMMRDRIDKNVCLEENTGIGQHGVAKDSRISLGSSGIVDQISSMLKKRGIEAHSHQPSKTRQRMRGEDSSDMSMGHCECKFECVRNPKNGRCFYTYTKDGKLKPIMKSENCCEKNKARLCDYDNIIEKYLCELTAKNDHVSKFLDDNFVCD
ncbi:uncharacterized protein VICG_01122 [Vittaforma corneae ATCC 50505]|uniref:Uncharacterized protein n=1 Tax=Vittaforma corneae (strain ATCC 50505) TaxID=993615 RepID=L2GMP4_VITCO|nr:uncharacterized protein VICG_01122 [Vittaforma corneae ATCC 50505]ELA41770.1 hypothetical protein VICG_01122 [Vittaforma corneae ATCC 50505]